MQKKKIATLIILGTIGITSLVGCKSDEIKKQLDTGITLLNEKQYEEAKNDFKEVIKEDPQNIEANDLINIITNYENAKKQYDNNNLESSEEFISKIPDNYAKYEIKNDIDNLKNEIEKKKSTIKKIETTLDKVDELIKAKKYSDAKNTLNTIDAKNATKEQKEKLTMYSKTIDKNLEELKIKEEEKKSKEKKQAIKSVENIEKTTSTNSSLKNKNNQLNKKSQLNKNSNIHYVSKKFGLQMELPASWNGHYSVDEYDCNGAQGICFSYESKNGRPGLLYSVNVNHRGSLEIPEGMYCKTINNVKYIMGKFCGGMDLDNPELETFNKLKSEGDLIARTIRSAN